MSAKVGRKRHDDVAPADMPEIEEARGEEEERGGSKELAEAVHRIREAVRLGHDPLVEDVELAQRYLGNAAVAALLSGRDLEDPQRKQDAEVDETQGRFKVALYVRDRFTQGTFDPGQVFLSLQDDKQQQIYGFHPQAVGPAALNPEGVAGEVRIDPGQIADAQKRAELDLTREQLEAIRVQIETFRGHPPNFDFWRWNSFHFVSEILMYNGLEVPKQTFDGLASPEVMLKAIQPRLEEEAAAEGEGDGEGEGDEEEEKEEQPTGAAPPDKPEEKGGKEEKKGFFRSLFGGGKGK